jgi:hypothetical protein
MLDDRSNWMASVARGLVVCLLLACLLSLVPFSLTQFRAKPLHFRDLRD